ncbi:hypothetical protein AB6A40_006273 [Gnathostoma spinigerum]|uniref:26S proteasome non-ATPase regulatory subunit 5 n=1 Tax=Gnathostoma spinigerum TaxID=75299 RepID=A0ABD6EQK5_9BILA
MVEDMLFEILLILCGCFSQIRAAAYLSESGIVDKMYSMFGKITDHPDAGFLFPGVIKFFGHFSVASPGCLTQYPLFLRSVFDLVYHFDYLDAAQRLLAFDTLSLVSSSNQSRILLSSSVEYDMAKAMRAFSVAVATGPIEMRVRNLDALALLFSSQHETRENNAMEVNTTNDSMIIDTKKRRVTDGSFADADITRILHTWFEYLGEAFPTFLLSYLVKPFPDLRYSSLGVLRQLLSYEWGIHTFMLTNGFLDYLLNRNTESESSGKLSKYDLVCLLIDSGSPSISSQELLRLKLYRKEGAYYVDRPPIVDTANQ